MPAVPRLVAAGLLAFSIAAAPLHAEGVATATREIFKQVALDPTTFGPAAVSYTAERLDWKSSQVFFQHGYLEHNPQFTISGRPDDVPISYGAGKSVILKNALMDLGTSAVNNAAVRIVERFLSNKYPNRKKLIRTMGWIERISFAVSLGTVQSSKHFRQWRENERLARELGYK
jgi:hypothetical protein